MKVAKIIFFFIQLAVASNRSKSFAAYKRMLDRMNVSINVVKYPPSYQSTQQTKNYEQNGNSRGRNYRRNAYRNRLMNGGYNWPSYYTVLFNKELIFPNKRIWTEKLTLIYKT